MDQKGQAGGLTAADLKANGYTDAEIADIRKDQKQIELALKKRKSKFIIKPGETRFLMESVKFHDLRATFITQLLLKGVPLAQVMAVVGHSELKTINRYLRIAGTDLEGVTDKLSYSIPKEELARVIELRPSMERA